MTLDADRVVSGSVEKAAMDSMASASSPNHVLSHAPLATAEVAEELDYDAWHATHGFQPKQVRCP